MTNMTPRTTRRAQTLAIRDNRIYVIQRWNETRGWNAGCETYFYRRQLAEGGTFTGPTEALKLHREGQY